MGKNKMIAKSCPKCELQVAVASKSCKCGHTFFASRRGADSLPPVNDIRRRTSRVIAQPKYYDAQYHPKQKKKSQKTKKDDDYTEKNESGISATARARRRRALRRATKRVPQQTERSRDPTPQLTPAQIARCHLILSEINRKMNAVTWQPPAE